ncbi:MAG: hypothetical protein QXI71_03810 [Candidatus Bathyarchaeia archaeon]
MKKDSPKKVMCLIVLSCTQVSEKGRTELEQAIMSLKQLENWEISRLTLMEDHRETI